MRYLGWIVIVSASLLTAATGCGSAKFEAKVEVKPPAPPPARPDADGDGVFDDGADKCLGEKEDTLAPDPTDGCKSSDPDGDGIAGDADKCPTEKETKNDFKDDDGCPDEMPKVAVIGNEVRIQDKILFGFGKATIDKASDDLLKNIAQVVKDNPQIEFLEVAGHADKVGGDPGNVLLTKARAQAVVVSLVKLGVDSKRMRGAGYGRYCPIDPGDSEEAREKNRRVEFKIMRTAGKDTGVGLGCSEAATAGIKPAGVPATAPAAKAGDEKKPADEKKAGSDKKPADEKKPADAKAVTPSL